ncbi:MAG: sigma-70 family RNA polymerase sigma factor [Fibrobacterales bacterium]
MAQLEEHFFRNEFARLTAILSNRFGLQYIEIIEDAVQTALIKAIESWPVNGEPDAPSAWLYRVAHNTILDVLRQTGNRQNLVEKYHSDLVAASIDETQPFFKNEAQDDLLRMVFVCCDASIPVESQLVLALKILCGFSIREIALRLFISEANVYKRLERGRGQLANLSIDVVFLTPTEYKKRLPVVMSVLYQLFTEGYLSSHEDAAIRAELCGEAIRLTTYVSMHPSGETPEVCALLALMHLHTARIPARHNDMGGLFLLEEQDRSLWDHDHITLGIHWLEQSAAGDHFSRYHAEAGIAAAHCLAPTFEDTPWGDIVGYYELLNTVAPSAMHRLNWAIAEAELHDASAGLALLETVKPPTWLEGSYLWSAVFADLYYRNGDNTLARAYKKSALDSAPNSFIKELLDRRLGNQ